MILIPCPLSRPRATRCPAPETTYTIVLATNRSSCSCYRLDRAGSSTRPPGACCSCCSLVSATPSATIMYAMHRRVFATGCLPCGRVYMIRGLIVYCHDVCCGASRSIRRICWMSPSPRHCRLASLSPLYQTTGWMLLPTSCGLLIVISISNTVDLLTNYRSFHASVSSYQFCGPQLYRSKMIIQFVKYSSNKIILAIRRTWTV